MLPVASANFTKCDYFVMPYQYVQLIIFTRNYRETKYGLKVKLMSQNDLERNIYENRTEHDCMRKRKFSKWVVSGSLFSLQARLKSEEIICK